MARRVNSAMIGVGVAAGVFLIFGVAAIAVTGFVPGVPFMAAEGPWSRERAIVSEKLRERHWNSRVREVRWWPPERGGKNHMSIRVRYATTNANGIVLSRDELWMIPDGSSGAVYMYDVSGP